MEVDDSGKNLRPRVGGAFILGLGMRHPGRMVLGGLFAIALLGSTARQTRLSAASGAGAPNGAPVLANPGNQINTDNSSYAQAVLADSPAAYWRLDEASGSTASDATGGAHAGVISGVVGLGKPGALADGNTAVQFNGSDTSRIVVPDTSRLSAINGASALTMEAWINPQSLTASPSQFRMFFSFPGNPVSYLGITNSGGAWKVIVALSIAGKQQHITVGPVLTPGTWYHTAATYDGSRLVLYVNGEVAGQITGLSGPLSIGTGGVLLGAHPSTGRGYAFTGSVDEAALYDRALSAGQVATHYARRLIAGGAVSLPLSASDPDSDPLTYSATGLPPPLSVNPATGLITGTLTRTSAGVHDVTVTASDGVLSHSQTFTWTVTHVNRTPVLTNPGNQTTRANLAVSLPASASDADNDALTYSISGLPASLTLNPQSGLVSGTVLPSDIGSYLVTLSVTDGQSTESQTFTWIVADPNRAPVLTNPGDQRTSGRRTSYSEALMSERPLAYWRLDDTTGTAVRDTVANSHGEREGAVLTGVAGALPDGNAAMSFDGADASRIVMPNGSVAAEINGGTAITMEAWINPHSAVLPARFRMFYSFPGAPASYLGITDAYGGSLKVIGALRINGTQRYLATGPVLTPGTWYHTALTYDGAQLTLFVNGSVAGQLTGLSGPISIGSSVLLGAHPTAGYSFAFAGGLDDAAIYDYALSPAQIARRYSRAVAADGEVRLPVLAVDPEGDTLSFSATGLPASLSIDPLSGVISGRVRPEDIGTYRVTVTATDGRLTSTVTFNWTVTDSTVYAGAVQTDAPVSFWRLGDSPTTDVVADSIGTNAGTRAGGVLAGLGGAIADGDMSMKFDGIDGSRIAIPHSASLAAVNNSSAVTLEAWINPQSAVLPSKFKMFYSFPGAPASYLGITDAYGGGLKIIAALRINGVQRYMALGPVLSVGSWYHTVATYDGSRMALYVNGSLAGEINGLSGPLSIGTGGILLGGHPSAGYSYSFNGLVDDAAIYNYALSATQVARHYGLRRAAPLTGLALYSSLDAPIPAGQQVTFTATATGGATPHEYKWFVYNSTTGWTIAKNWSTSNVLVWTPTIADRWAQITVWARTSGDPTDAPERFVEAPFPVFVVSPSTTSRLLSQGNGKFSLLRTINWTNTQGAEGYRLQIGTSLGGAEILDTGVIQATAYDASAAAAGPLPRSAVAWDYDPNDLTTAGYGLALDDERTDFGSLPPSLCKTVSGPTPCYRIPLPALSTGTHQVAVAAYNDAGETWAPPVQTTFSDPELYVRLWTKHGGVWRYVDEQFSAEDVAASFIYPLPFSVRVDLWRPFRWSAIDGADAYSLTIGLSPGGGELVSIPETTETSALLPALPGGVTLFARLGTRFKDVWRYTEIAFVAKPALAHLVYPIQGSRVELQGRFSWLTVGGVDAYSLDIGTTFGGNDVISSGELQTDMLDYSGLPPGTLLYAKLGTKVKGTWIYVHTTFISAAVPGSSPLAQFITPTDGAELGSDAFDFTWTEVPGVFGYHLHIGTTPGADNIGMSPDYQQERHWLANNLPRGVLLYARLYTQFQVGDWDHYVDIFFTVPPVPQQAPGSESK